jgi:hypothetical protein
MKGESLKWKGPLKEGIAKSCTYKAGTHQLMWKAINNTASPDLEKQEVNPLTLSQVQSTVSAGGHLVGIKTGMSLGAGIDPAMRLPRLFDVVPRVVILNIFVCRRSTGEWRIMARRYQKVLCTMSSMHFIMVKPSGMQAMSCNVILSQCCAQGLMPKLCFKYKEALAKSPS